MLTNNNILVKQEISELLSGKLTSEDEEEILAELAQIEKERVNILNSLIILNIIIVIIEIEN